MSEQIFFFDKSKCDISNSGVSATATQGDEFAELVLNRSNANGWITTGSVDADQPTLTIDMADERPITDILLVKHNFKSFTVKYWDGSSFVDFSPAINETTNTDETSHFEVEQVETTKIQLQVNGTMTPDEDKILYQLIATRRIGQLAGWPVIKKPVHSTNAKKSTMLSGKTFVARNLGAFSCELAVAEWRNSADLEIVEELYENTEGFLVWLSGGSEDQFSSTRKGYRLEDVYLMKCLDDYSPEFVSGQYKRGLAISIKLGEVVP
jgi:hypothetical protein